MRWNLVHRCVLAWLAVAAFAMPAAAQSQPSVELSRFEVSLALTVNGLHQDVNAAPTCVTLQMPCTHEQPSRFGGFGLDIGVARNLSRRAAVVVAVSTFATAWDARLSALEQRRMWAHSLSVNGGPRISTGFLDPGTGRREPGRFFGQLLVGAERSNVTPLSPSLLVGGGADVVLPVGRSGASRRPPPGV
jgi:hypothetical protein